MPYYLHHASLTLDALQLAADTLALPPREYRHTSCGCEDCSLAAWESYDASNEARPVADGVIASFPTAALAHTAKKGSQADTPLTVTFLATLSEKQTWRERERGKVRGAGFNAVPWHSTDWYQELAHIHHAYLSVGKPGLVAYTPSEEWGVSDRQLIVRPGRYLEQFAPDTDCYWVHHNADSMMLGERFTSNDEAQARKVMLGSHVFVVTYERDYWCARVKAMDDMNKVHFASTADDIVRVYSNGPDSCMSHELSDYETDDVHPCRAYGDSDVQCAYLLNVDNPSRIRARVMVWGDKKIYSRVYGDTAISHQLEMLGFTRGGLDGAHIRAIEVDSDVYLMPYIDGIDTASLVKRGGATWFRLDNDGRYGCQNTTGVSNSSYRAEPEDEDTNSCAHCGEECGVDDVYCDSCDESRWMCSHCNEEFFDTRSFDVDNIGAVCRDCRDELREQCDCGEYFFPISFFIRERRRREAFEVHDTHCEDCADDAIAERETEAETARLIRDGWIMTIALLQERMLTNRFRASTNYVAYEVAS